MRQYAQVVYTIHTTCMYGQWRIIILLVTCHSSFQHRFSVNVWIGIADGYVTGPYVIQDHLGGVEYADILEETFPLLFEN
jgi:hypothetical protein